MIGSLEGQVIGRAEPHGATAIDGVGEVVNATVEEDNGIPIAAFRNYEADMASTKQFVIETLQVAGLLGDGGSDSVPGGACDVQTNFPASERDASSVGLTAAEYTTLQGAYDYFNVALFAASLPQVLITLQRHHRALGYFSARRFQRRGHVRQRVHEVALNPDGFTGHTDKAILSTLVHEMVHVWQQEHGHPGRGRYHNREWARKMCDIGLMPSTTGRPGGAVTGESVSHYVMEDGEFSAACSRFLNRYRLVWESAELRANETSGDESRDEDESRTGDDSAGPSKITTQTRTKFTCPNCGLNVWAKPDALVDCHRCSIEAQELVVMCANYARRVGKRVQRTTLQLGSGQVR